MAIGAGETGEAVAAARAAVARRDTALAEADRQLADVLAAAYLLASESGQRIEAIGAEIDAAVAGRSTEAPAGAAEMARMLLVKQREIADIVAAAVHDSDAKTTVLQRLRELYDPGYTG
jgi:hypothetical protein